MVQKVNRVIWTGGEKAVCFHLYGILRSGEYHVQVFILGKTTIDLYLRTLMRTLPSQEESRFPATSSAGRAISRLRRLRALKRLYGSPAFAA
ncbi:MAG: hypothetical protein LBR82_11215 [Desulfovibrio sp.]|jgi:hypothetical protein|nr:hypothetical protein [Desulfovibrio sp.]